MKTMAILTVLVVVTFRTFAGDIPKYTGLYYEALGEKYEHQVVKVFLSHLSSATGTEAEPIAKHKGFLANTVYKGADGSQEDGGKILVAVPVSAVEPFVTKYGLVAGKKALALEGELMKLSTGKLCIRFRPEPPKPR